MNEAHSLFLPKVLFGELLLAFGSLFFSSVNGNQNMNSARLTWGLSQSRQCEGRALAEALGSVSKIKTNKTTNQ